MLKPHLAELRSQHPRFVFESLSYNLEANNLEVEFLFHLEPDLTFKPRLTFHAIDLGRYQSLDKKLIHQWLLRIGMVELLSYWKAACSPEIVIKAGFLKAEELNFWQNLLQQGMSEFFFVNHIDGWEEGFVRLSVDAEQEPYTLDTEQKADKVLVPMGGGKDSVVTVETVKKLNLPLSLFSVNPKPAAQRVNAVANISEHIEVSRFLDPQLLSLNKIGYLNGHTPFSALLAFLSTFSAYLCNFKYIALSNEWSANEGNISFLGHTINHQYSKSLNFEKDFRRYVTTYLSTSIEYFSFLRPLHEIQIAQLFKKYPQYFSSFLSCNRGSNEGVWCGVCPKCVFAAIILSPFLSSQQIIEIFRKDILNDSSLIPVLDELTGMVELKSLECVGTRDESLVALAETIRSSSSAQLPALLQYARDKILISEKELDQKIEQVTRGYQTENFLPTQFDDILKKEVR
jgi:UDP-N-acetyl-alpha-D-muramoyl-L-alanyl-L-glutamate epimerase